MTATTTTAPLGAATVFRTGFGAMQLAGPGVMGPPADRDAALAVLRRAVELGVDHIDTAQYYGPDVVNELIREALYPYEDLSIVSKVGARRTERGGWPAWDRPEDLRQGIEDNLRALGVERLAAVNLRRADGGTSVPLAEQVDAMVQARDDGLIAGIGLSNVSADDLRQVLARTQVVCVQNPYSVADRSSQAVLDLCAERGVAFVPFFPLGNAFGGAQKVLGHPGVVAAAARTGATTAQVALAWLLAQGDHVLLIPGTSSVAHLEENVAALDVELSAEEMATITG